MGQKYSIIYKDVVNIEHECQIFDDDYIDNVIDIQGRVYLDASSADDNLEAIRGLGLRVELEADETLTYSDLYSEEEKTFSVKYYRDSVLLFDGWLNPEGWYEDFVNLKWRVSFDCVDGFGYLNNLSFVNSNGTPITGKKTQLEVISLALLRTGLQKDICVAIDIYYTGLSTAVCVLDNVYVIADRYIKDDGDTLMSCDEVLKDILEPYGAVLKSYGGKWYIYKPNQLYSNRSQTFYLFDYLGAAGTGFTEDFTQSLGSHILGFDPHHASENQSISVAPSTGAYRISYKYGLAQGLIDNTTLCSDDGSTIDDWTIVSMTNVVALVAGECGVTFTNVAIGSIVENIRNVVVELTAGIKVDVAFNANLISTTVISRLSYQVIASDDVIGGSPTATYYLQDDNTWGAVNVTHKKLKTVVGSGSSLNATSFTTDAIPAALTGTVYFYIRFWTPYQLGSPEGQTILNSASLAINPDSVESSNLEGEFHTFQRTTKPSAQVKNIKEVATGDNSSDVYVGTIYKADGTTPTETWFRNGITEAKPILRIMGEETMRMNQLPTRIFSGGVYGFISYLSVLEIDGLDGLFMILEYSYDTKENRIEMTSRQILGNELTDIDYELTFDYGNTVKPTIVG